MALFDSLFTIQYDKLVFLFVVSFQSLDVLVGVKFGPVYLIVVKTVQRRGSTCAEVLGVVGVVAYKNFFLFIRWQ